MAAANTLIFRRSGGRAARPRREHRRLRADDGAGRPGGAGRARAAVRAGGLGRRGRRRAGGADRRGRRRCGWWPGGRRWPGRCGGASPRGRARAHLGVHAGPAAAWAGRWRARRRWSRRSRPAAWAEPATARRAGAAGARRPRCWRWPTASTTPAGAAGRAARAAATRTACPCWCTRRRARWSWSPGACRRPRRCCGRRAARPRPARCRRPQTAPRPPRADAAGMIAGDVSRQLPCDRRSLPPGCRLGLRHARLRRRRACAGAPRRPRAGASATAVAAGQVPFVYVSGYRPEILIFRLDVGQRAADPGGQRRRRARAVVPGLGSGGPLPVRGQRGRRGHGCWPSPSTRRPAA